MKLDLSQIKEITTGASRITEENGFYKFSRFTQEQEDLYRNRKYNNPALYNRSLSSSGIAFKFITDSRYIFLDAEVEESTSRSYFSFDFFVNGARVDSLNNFDGVELPKAYTTIDLPLGSFSKTVNLGEGEKEVVVYFPFSLVARIKEVSIEDNSIIKPIKSAKKLLAFGDSITHGYDAVYTSNKYITMLANYLGADEHNKAVGGEIFFPELALTRENYTPDYVTVAYGTNDWSNCDYDTFSNNMKAFMSNISTTYATSKILVITPIWRKDNDDKGKAFPFEDLESSIIAEAGKYENITVVSGIDLVPHDEDYFADLRLHPNDKGFEKYYNNLTAKFDWSK